MELTTFDDAAKQLVSQLEVTLAKLAVAAESNIPTGELENKAKKLAGLLKSSVELFGGLPIYKDVKGTEIYSWHLADLPDDIFFKLACLCKNAKQTLDVRKEDNLYFAKVSDGLFINLADIVEPEMPTFKVKIENNTLMAVRADLLSKLPKATQALLLEVKGDNNDE